MEAFDMTPDSTVRTMVASNLRTDEVLRELETDHDLAVLLRKLREHSAD